MVDYGLDLFKDIETSITTFQSFSVAYDTFKEDSAKSSPRLLSSSPLICGFEEQDHVALRSPEGVGLGSYLWYFPLRMVKAL
jgi:hypothetical protein